MATVLIASVCSATASAAVINFDDIDAPGPGGHGTIVNDRYGNLGVTFNNPEAFDYSEGPFAIPNFAHSPNVAVEPCVGVEFCSSPVRALFTAPQERVTVWVGFSFPLNSPLGVRLTGFNGSGAVVGTDDETLPANPNPTPVSVPLTINLADPLITRLEVSVTTGGGYTSSLAVDDVEFSTVGPPPPCTAAAPPTVTLSQPADGLVVDGDAFPLAGTVANNGAPITAATIVARSSSVREASVYPTLVSASGGSFGPISFGGVLSLGVNDVTVTATNCRGTGTSNSPRVIRTVPQPGPHAAACVPQADHPAVHVVENAADLVDKLRSDFQGQLIVPPGDYDLSAKAYGLTEYESIPLDPGVQLVGERGQLGRRPLIHSGDPVKESGPFTLFTITGPDVCVEGLNIQGPSTSPARDQPKTFGLRVIENPCAYRRSPPSAWECADPPSVPPDPVVIADNELWGWTGGAVSAQGTIDFPKREAPAGYEGPRMIRDDANKVLVERNYIHDNARDTNGYGVVVENSAYVTVYGNTFDFNRHDVTSEGVSFSGYLARFNYGLEGGYRYGGNDGYYGPHFDVHGTGGGDDHVGGQAGEYHEIAYNTIRGEQKYDCDAGFCKVRAALVLRGRPSDGIDFNRNVLVQKYGKAVVFKGGNDDSLDTDEPSTFNYSGIGNHHDTDYSTKLATGDFDSDGLTDVFLSNGTGWFFSRGGIRPWEFLRPSNKLVSKLGFADIDNDGATDVLYLDGAGNLGYVKSGTAAALTDLTTVPKKIAMSDLRFGDFNGDGRTDIFYTLNRQWQVWYGSTGPWTQTATSRLSIDGMLFGEFDDVGGTDIAAVTGGRWSYSSGSTATWERLNAKLRSSFQRAVAEDFDGNGKTDIAFSNADAWRYSPDGRKPLRRLRRNVDDRPLDRLLVGDFADQPRATVIAYGTHDRNKFGIWRGLGSQNDFVKHSEQSMR